MYTWQYMYVCMYVYIYKNTYITLFQYVSVDAVVLATSLHASVEHTFLSPCRRKLNHQEFEGVKGYQWNSIL